MPVTAGVTDARFGEKKLKGPQDTQKGNPCDQTPLFQLEQARLANEEQQDIVSRRLYSH